MFSRIEEYFEEHEFTKNVLLGVLVLTVFIGGKWALASWLVSEAHPNTPLAHTYCAIISTNDDGTYDSEVGHREYSQAKNLAYEQGGQKAVDALRAKTQSLLEEYATYTLKGDVNDIRHHYQEKCLGY